MWIRDRSRALERCTASPWDLLVVGGGVVGAAVLWEAARAGLRGLLVERADFAAGTSSRSSKLVHGGFRYLAHGHVRLVREAARERQRLLSEVGSPVTPVGFTFAMYDGDGTSLPAMRLGTRVYGLLARPSTIEELSPASVLGRAPGLRAEGLRRGFRTVEGRVDDARLVLRLIADAVAAGAGALNYVAAEVITPRPGGSAVVALRDIPTGRPIEVAARVVVNATGTAANDLRPEAPALALRPVRGSHLLFSAERFPLADVLAFRHPHDGRYVSAAPWEGAIVVGTTERAHAAPLDEAPAAQPDEVVYLLAGVQALFPGLALAREDIVATLGGVRAVVDERRGMTAASREDVLLAEEAVITVTGGKLTTFRPVARRVLEVARPHLPPFSMAPASGPTFPTPDLPANPTLGAAAARRLLGRYGAATAGLLEAALPGELECVPGTPTTWAEVRWAARAEGVVHLADLLLRRTRLGLLLRWGGEQWLSEIRDVVRDELGWTSERWEGEVRSYQRTWQAEHGVPRTLPGQS